MAEGTIEVRVDEATLSDLMKIVATEHRPSSQVLSIALRSVLGLSVGSRRALFAIDGSSTEQERSFATKAIGRSVLKAYDRILDARHQGDLPDLVKD